MGDLYIVIENVFNVADPDDLMGQSNSDSDGVFEVQGFETEVTDIDPKLNIYHNCEDEQHVSLG